MNADLGPVGVEVRVDPASPEATPRQAGFATDLFAMALFNGSGGENAPYTFNSSDLSRKISRLASGIFLLTRERQGVILSS